MSPAFIAIAGLLAQYAPELIAKLIAICHKPDGSTATVDELNSVLAEFAKFKADTLDNKLNDARAKLAATQPS